MWNSWKETNPPPPPKGGTAQIEDYSGDYVFKIRFVVTGLINERRKNKK